jgi:hypothetical protein
MLLSSWCSIFYRTQGGFRPFGKQQLAQLALESRACADSIVVHDLTVRFFDAISYRFLAESGHQVD